MTQQKQTPNIKVLCNQSLLNFGTVSTCTLSKIMQQ